MLEAAEKPLLTFALVAYNQERFIREAVEGAFSQTYSPLEIILSDDCSPDGTYEIMRQMAAEYRGPHRIVLNRAPRNLGIIGHLNRVVELARGDLFVGAAGDDISLPKRAELCHQAWVDSGRRSASIWSEYSLMDEFGNALATNGQQAPSESDPRFEHLQTRPVDVAGWRSRMAFGCTQAFSTELFRSFGPLPLLPSLMNEDSPIFFRAALLAGQVTRINMPLVRYRRHGANASSGVIGGVATNGPVCSASVGLRQRQLKRLMAVAKCFWRDSHAAVERGIYAGDDGQQLRREVARSYRAFQLRSQLLEGGSWKRLGPLWKLARLGRARRFVVLELWRTIWRSF